MTRAAGLGAWPARAPRKAARRPAMTYQGHTTTYAMLTTRVSRLAHALDSIGVRAGTRVAYLGSNHPALLESLFATAALGAIFVPLNARLSPAEISFMLDDSGAEVLVFGRGSVPTVEGLDARTHPMLIAVDADVAGALDYAAVLTGGSEEPVDAT